eukprot:902497-Amphidinium_carterae.1
MATSTVAVNPRIDLKRPATVHTEDVVRSSTSSQKGPMVWSQSNHSSACNSVEIQRWWWRTTRTI